MARQPVNIALIVLFIFVFTGWKFDVFPFAEELFVHDGYGIHLFGGIGYTAFQVLIVKNIFKGPRLPASRFYTAHAVSAVIILEVVELLQYFQPSRQVQIGDMIAQTIGVLITVFVLWLTQHKKETR